jgi:hypothetical protein
MKTMWKPIADCLRAEIAEFGGLLQLFEEQQLRLFARDADAVLRLSAEIEAQVGLLHDCRLRREQAAVDFASAHGHPAGATLRSMLPSVDAEARPLLEALIAEINRLIFRTRRATRHNHALLASTVRTHQELLRQLRPDAFNQTYSANGRMGLAGPRSRTAFKVAG